MEKEQISEWFKSLQHEICGELSRLDQSLEIKSDLWQRDGGGGGDTRILSGGVIEKGGVNFSAVHGKTPQKILDALKLQESRFYATGISIVLHPVNPHAPIIHMNLRYFEMSTGESWFGGGIDLTPHYLDLEDAAYFHTQVKSTCDQFHPSYYPKFKKWADDYFFIKCNGKYEKVYFDEILFVQAMQNYVIIYTKEQKFTTLLNLKTVAQYLDTNMFLQVHKSYIVSVPKINRLETHEIMICDHKIPISRNFRKEVVEQIVGNKLWKNNNG